MGRLFQALPTEMEVGGPSSTQIRFEEGFRYFIDEQEVSKEQYYAEYERDREQQEASEQEVREGA
jgi:hypothetical protein